MISGEVPLSWHVLCRFRGIDAASRHQPKNVACHCHRCTFYPFASPLAGGTLVMVVGGVYRVRSPLPKEDRQPSWAISHGLGVLWLII